MFLKIDENRVVSLDCVTNINYLNDKIVFNLCYSIETSKGLMSDFIYLPKSKENLIKCNYFYDNFVFVCGKDRKVAINKNHISTVRLDKEYNKIIFAFKHPVDSRGIGKNDTIAEHFYIKFENLDDAKFIYDEVIQDLQNL